MNKLLDKIYRQISKIPQKVILTKLNGKNNKKKKNALYVYKFKNYWSVLTFQRLSNHRQCGHTTLLRKYLPTEIKKNIKWLTKEKIIYYSNNKQWINFAFSGT